MARKSQRKRRNNRRTRKKRGGSWINRTHLTIAQEIYSDLIKPSIAQNFSTENAKKFLKSTITSEGNEGNPVTIVKLKGYNDQKISDMVHIHATFNPDYHDKAGSGDEEWLKAIKPWVYAFKVGSTDLGTKGRNYASAVYNEYLEKIKPLLPKETEKNLSYKEKLKEMDTDALFKEFNEEMNHVRPMWKYDMDKKTWIYNNAPERKKFVDNFFKTKALDYYQGIVRIHHLIRALGKKICEKKDGKNVCENQDAKEMRATMGANRTLQDSGKGDQVKWVQYWRLRLDPVEHVGFPPDTEKRAWFAHDGPLLKMAKEERDKILEKNKSDNTLKKENIEIKKHKEKKNMIKKKFLNAKCGRVATSEDALRNEAPFPDDILNDRSPKTKFYNRCDTLKDNYASHTAAIIKLDNKHNNGNPQQGRGGKKTRRRKRKKRRKRTKKKRRRRTKKKRRRRR